MYSFASLVDVNFLNTITLSCNVISIVTDRKIWLFNYVDLFISSLVPETFFTVLSILRFDY